MKHNLTIRRGILLLLALFGVIIGGTIFFTARYARNTFVNGEYENAIEILTILGRQIEKNLSDNDKGISGDPFRFLQTAAAVQKAQENFSFLIRDSLGIVLAPDFAAGKPLPMTRVHWLTRDKGCCLASVWGSKCFVVFYPMPKCPLELLAIYDNDYMFAEVYHTILLFSIVLSAVYLILVLLSWLWIIPAVERMNEQKNRAENELLMAHDLQLKAVTRKFPAAPWFDIHAELRAMKDVGGDSYLCGMVGKKLGFVVGDVSDKGMSAAFMMFTISSYIRSRVQTGIALDQLMEEVNRLICDNPDYEMFCTLFMGIIDPDTLEMEYCNAGHTRTILNGDFLTQDPQFIAGIEPGFKYHVQHRQLLHGDRLLLYTDGVTEARDEHRAFFGEERLRAWMAERPADAGCREDCAGLLDTLADFRGKALQNDDIAIMSIRIQ